MAASYEALKSFVYLITFTGLALNVQSKYFVNENVKKLLAIDLQSHLSPLGNSTDEGDGVCEPVNWTNNEECLIGPVTIKEDIAKDVFYQLCPQSTGMFQAPSSCDLYLTCHFNQLTVNRCPKTYHFQQSKQHCVPADKFECLNLNPVLGSNPTSMFQNKGLPKRTKRFMSSVQEALVPSASNHLTHLVHKRSVKAKGRYVKRCPNDFIQPHPYDCSQFQICSNGQFYSQKCGPGTLFNPLSAVCDDPRNVDCTSSMSDLGTYDCPKGYFYITSHFEDCTKFVECFDGSLKIKSCSQDTVFNPEEGICDFKYHTECRNPISLEHDTDVNYKARKSRDLAKKYSCEFNYIAPVEDSCNEFIECEERSLFRKTCGPGTAYNRLLGQCDWPYNVRAPDPNYCSAYLQCDGKRYVSRKCQQKTFFNTNSGKCEPLERVDCTGKVDDPRNQGTLNRSK